MNQQQKTPEISAEEHNQRLEEMRAVMHRMKLIIEKVKNGEASESELAEHKKIRDKIDRIPINTLTG